MTGQSLLDLMEIVNPELQLQPAESDVAKGLLALNAAQDMFESMLAAEAGMFGGSTSTVVTTANQEHTTFPAGLLRLDRLQFLDPTTSKPSWDLINIKRVGGHTRGLWFWNLVSGNQAGSPRAYYTDGTRIWWRPTPDGASTIRYYGFLAASDITAGGTFAYPDASALPLATIAAAIIMTGLGDSPDPLHDLATKLLVPVIDRLRRYNQDGAQPYRYDYRHDT